MKFTRRKILTHSGVSLAAMAAADPLSGCLVSHRRKPVQFNYPETRRPNPGDAPYSKTPIAASYEERRQMYLYWASKHATPKSRGGVLNDLLKLEAGTIKTPSVEALEEALSFKRDTSDFTIAGLVRLYYLHHADGKLTKEQADGIRTALLGYKYALDEPGLSEAEIWTENHQILCHGSDYLVGQMFPDATFTNDGRTGQQHRDKAKSLVLRWLAFRACVGPVE